MFYTIFGNIVNTMMNKESKGIEGVNNQANIWSMVDWGIGPGAVGPRTIPRTVGNPPGPTVLLLALALITVGAAA